jgi:Flp pilus assembly protein TadD
LFELNDIENADRAFKQALILAPDDPLIIINDIVCLLHIKRKDLALELFRKFNTLLQENIPISKEIMPIVSKLSTELEGSVSEISHESEENNNDQESVSENTAKIDELTEGDISPRELASDEV